MNDGVSYRQLGLIFLAFALGICSALLFQNTGAGQPTTFATTELIGEENIRASLLESVLIYGDCS